MERPARPRLFIVFLSLFLNLINEFKRILIVITTIIVVVRKE